MSYQYWFYLWFQFTTSVKSCDCLICGSCLNFLTIANKVDVPVFTFFAGDLLCSCQMTDIYSGFPFFESLSCRTWCSIELSDVGHCVTTQLSRSPGHHPPLVSKLESWLFSCLLRVRELGSGSAPLHSCFPFRPRGEQGVSLSSLLHVPQVTFRSCFFQSGLEIQKLRLV